MSRELLPYRKEVSIFLIKGNKVMAQDNGKFIIFPGGGVDTGETLKTALKREVLEETGVIINNDLSFISDVKSDFYQEWADISDKRKKRYNKFKGGHIFIFVGTVKEIKTPTSNEGDEWSGNIWIPITKVIKLINEREKNQHPNDRAFRSTQKAILSSILYQRKYKI